MKDKLHNSDLDRLTFNLLHNFSDRIQEDPVPPSPYFMSRLRSRIAHEYQSSQVWEVGVISAKNWLLVLSLVALLILGGNLVILKRHLNPISSHLGNQSLNISDERDFIHPDEDVEALNVDEFQKE